MKTLFFVLALLLVKGIAQAQPQRETVLIESFKQGNAGNCASISVIKLAIDKYGENGVLQKLDSTATDYLITLRDGTQLILTKEEWHSFTRNMLDQFVLLKNPAIFKEAKFLYAIMAKNKFLIDNNAHPGTHISLADAAVLKDKRGRVVKSRQGNTTPLLAQDTGINFQYLGLGKKCETLDLSLADTTPSIILTNIKHSAYGGMSYYDQEGKVCAISSFTTIHGDFLPRVFGLRNLNQTIYHLKD